MAWYWWFLIGVGTGVGLAGVVVVALWQAVDTLVKCNPYLLRR